MSEYIAFISSPFNPLHPRNLMFCFVCLAVYSVYTRLTYRWEYTYLADVIRPNQRRTCVLPQYPDATFYVEKPLKVGIVMMYESTDNLTKAWSDELLQPLIENRETYCKKHSYTLLDANHLIDYERSASWSKLLALEHYFKSGSYDYLMYMDMDVIIMNPDVRIEQFIDASRRAHDLLITEDINGINAGVFIMRNSPWSLWFLRTAWVSLDLT